MYKITVDRGHALVKIEMRAMLDVADSGRLVSELIAQITEARLASYALILDIAQCPIQSQEMIAAMGEHLTKMRPRDRDRHRRDARAAAGPPDLLAALHPLHFDL